MSTATNEGTPWNDRRWVRYFYRSLFLATGLIMLGIGLGSLAWGESVTGSGFLGYYIGRNGVLSGLTFILASFQPWRILEENSREANIEPYQNVTAVITIAGVAALLFSSIFAVSGVIALGLGKAGSLGFTLTGIGLGTIAFLFLRTAHRMQSSS
jgi:hypothetical protein